MGAGFIDSRRTGERQGDAVVRFALFAFLSLFLATASIAADYEYGSLDELKGVSRVYIDAGNAVDLRNIMATVIKKRLPSIEVLTSADGADLALIFDYKQLGRKAFIGELLAVKSSGERLRLVAKYRHDEEELNDLADEIIKQFVKDYKRKN